MKPQQTYIRRAAFLLISVFMVGCADRFVVHVDSIRDPSPEGSTRYVLLSSNKDVSTEDLQFKEFAQYVHRALHAKGYRLVNDSEVADLAIFLHYGIGDTQTQS